jgi:hypothetical protein
MEFGLDIDTKARVKPKTGQRAICQCCEELLIPKCGKIRVHHWSHKNAHCDHWWESETEWHRQWKGLFPSDWREVIKIDFNTNEKHIADVCNPFKDLVIEFQNSPISIEELNSREIFYKKMIWVVNAKDCLITTSQIQSIHQVGIEIVNKIISRQINDSIKIPNDTVKFLYNQRDILIKNMKIDSFKQDFKELEIHFEKEYLKIIKKFMSGESRELKGVKPTVVLKELFNSLLNYLKDKFDNYILKNESLDENNCYLSYHWKWRKKVWNFAKMPIFLDQGGEELLWLQTNSILKKVPKDKFISKYGIYQEPS